MAELTVVDCRQCGHRMAPPAYACSSCGSVDLASVNIPGVGSLYTYTTIYVPPAGFEQLVPYTVAVVEVEGGLLLAGRMRSPDEQQAIGDPVQLVELDQDCRIFAAVNP